MPYEPFIPTQMGQIRTTSPSSRLETVNALPPMQEFVTAPLPSSSRPQHLSYLGNLDTHPDHEALVQHVAQLQAQVTRLTTERNPAQQPHEDPPGYKESWSTKVSFVWLCTEFGWPLFAYFFVVFWWVWRWLLSFSEIRNQYNSYVNNAPTKPTLRDRWGSVGNPRPTSWINIFHWEWLVKVYVKFSFEHQAAS